MQRDIPVHDQSETPGLDAITRSFENGGINGLELKFGDRIYDCSFRLMHKISELHGPINKIATELSRLFGIGTRPMDMIDSGHFGVRSETYSKELIIQSYERSDLYKVDSANKIQELKSRTYFPYPPVQFQWNNQNAEKDKVKYLFGQLLQFYNQVVDHVNSSSLLLLFYNSMIKDHGKIFQNKAQNDVKKFIDQNDGSINVNGLSTIPRLKLNADYENDTDEDFYGQFIWILHVISSPLVPLDSFYANYGLGRSRTVGFKKMAREDGFGIANYDIHYNPFLLFFDPRGNWLWFKPFIDYNLPILSPKYEQLCIPLVELMTFCHDLLSCIKNDLGVYSGLKPTSEKRNILKNDSKVASHFELTMNLLLNNMKNGSFVITSFGGDISPSGFLPAVYNYNNDHNYYKDRVPRIFTNLPTPIIENVWTPNLVYKFPNLYEAYFGLVESYDGKYDEENNNTSYGGGGGGNSSMFDRMDTSKKICASCNKIGTRFRCGGKMCTHHYYCDENCQIRDWINHKKECNN